MQRTQQIAASALLLISLTHASPHAPNPPLPVNCTIEFDHTFTPDELVEQLRDDNIRHNLDRALPVLLSHPDLTPGFMYEQLDHEDWQVRQIMAREIWKRTSPGSIRRVYTSYLNEDPPDPTARNGSAHPDYPITETLVRVTIEGLRDDTTPYDFPRRRGLCYANASFGLSVLTPIAHEWSELLIRAMDSDDPQQRVLSATILGYGGVESAAQRACEILLPHLRDNDLYDDAKFCAPVLFAFGDVILPHLSEALPSADAQQRDLILLLIKNLKTPPRTDEERRANARYNTITGSVHDPVSSPAPTSMFWLSQLRDRSTAHD